MFLSVFLIKPFIIGALRVQLNCFHCWGAKSNRENRNKSKETSRQTTLRFLTNESIAAFAALLIVPLPRQVKVVVVGQNGAQRFPEQLVLLWSNTETRHVSCFRQQHNHKPTEILKFETIRSSAVDQRRSTRKQAGMCVIFDPAD